MPKRRKVSNLLALSLLTLLMERPRYPYEMATALRQRGKDNSMIVRMPAGAGGPAGSAAPAKVAVLPLAAWAPCVVGPDNSGVPLLRISQTDL